MHETNRQLLLAIIHAWRLVLLFYLFLCLGPTGLYIIVQWHDVDRRDVLEILGCSVKVSAVIVVIMLFMALGINSIPQYWYGQ
jgi:Na+/serine symporter